MGARMGGRMDLVWKRICPCDTTVTTVDFHLPDRNGTGWLLPACPAPPSDLLTLVSHIVSVALPYLPLLPTQSIVFTFSKVIRHLLDLRCHPSHLVGNFPMALLHDDVFRRPRFIAYVPYPVGW